nr:Cysteine and glycine-rich protein 1 [Polyrhizophydium stewartii]
MSARDNRGDGISSAYLSSGLRGGVEAGLRRMMGDDSQPVDHACLDCGRRLTCESELFVGPAHAGGQVYCEACYSRQFKKGDCETCRKPVLGLGREYVMQEGKVWHKECFSGRSCHECSEVVFGQGVEAIGKVFHPECFVTPINGKYVLDAGQIYHPECRVALVAGGANPVCQKCRKPITGRFVKLDEATLLHGECFVCAGCGTGLGGQAFGDTAQGPKCEGCLRKQASAGPKFVPGFTVNQAGLKEVRGPGGAKVGDNAALKALGGTTTCPKCAKGVFPFEKVGGPLNTSWHKACLKCTKCSRALDSMAKMRELEPFCTACATF